MARTQSVMIGFVLLYSCNLGATPAAYHELSREWRHRLVQDGTQSFGITELKELIEGQDLRSVESVLPLLPRDLLTNYVLMEKSQSLQGATEKDPRVLLFGDRGRFVLTFNGDRSERGFNSLEMMEYKNHQYEFRRVDFSASKEAAVFSEANPKRCQGCHQNPLRPNWARYPFWAGAVGETDSLKPADEVKFRQFIDYGATHPRYKHLNRAENLANIKSQTLKTNPAFHLDVLFDSIDADRLPHWIGNTREYKRYKYATLAALIDCDDFVSFLPTSPIHNGIRQWETLNKDTIEGHASVPSPNLRLLDNIEYRIITNLRYVFERRGISIRSWAKPLEHEFFMTTVASVFFGEIAWQLRKQDEDLMAVPIDYPSYLRHFSRLSFPTLYTPQNEKEMRFSCEILQEKSRDAFH